MTEDEVERTLRAAFAARAGDAVPDTAPVPPPRFLTEAPARPGRRVHFRSRLLAPVAAAAAVLLVAGGIYAVAGRGGGGSGDRHPIAGHSATVHPSATSAPVPASAARAVHVRLFNADGVTYGVGMPVIAIFSRKITDARPFVRATRVTVNDAPVQASWYFESSVAGLGAMEAHLRPKAYWPAHAKVHVTLATAGLSAGRGLAFDDSLTLDFTTGARTVATVDGRTNYLTVTTDGKPIARMPVSLGAVMTPTSGGTKVVMGKQAKVRLKGPGYEEVVPYALQLTYSGEYLVGVPARAASIKQRLDTSNGCTDLLVADAARLYRMLRVGDPVQYLHSQGPSMASWDGFGDWNVPWPKWQSGGLLPTS